MTNCTVVDNFAADRGGGVFATNAYARLTMANCVLWGNGAPSGPELAVIQRDNDRCSVTVSYSDLSGGPEGVYGEGDYTLHWGAGNIDADPLFADSAGDDYRLTSQSPCIDAADNDALPGNLAADLDGNPRSVDDPGTGDTGNGMPPIVEMGAYEFQGGLVAQLDIRPGSCPNPLNRKSQGVLPVALVGTDELDVTQVDLDSLVLTRADGVGGGVTPLMGPPGPRIRVQDVATPFAGELCDCHELDGDGIDDLAMKFRTPEIIAALELSTLPGGTSIELNLSGVLLDQTPFSARDCVVLVPHGSGAGALPAKNELSDADVNAPGVDTPDPRVGGPRSGPTARLR
jgi:hypothetical protein